MRRRFSLMIAAVALACAGGQNAGGASAGTSEKQRVRNIVPFDLASCFPSKLDLGKTGNEYTLQAGFRAARPDIQECLVDASRVQVSSGSVKGKAALSLDATGTKVTISGDGLQPAASSCIEKAIRAQLEGVSAPAGGKPLTLEAPFEREANTIVQMGVNEASDVEGTIRLALPQWCSCFEGMRSKAPPELTGTITLNSAEMLKYADRLKAPDGGALPTRPVVAAVQPSDPSGAQVASCVGQQIEALPLKSKSEQFLVPLAVLLVNSNGPPDVPAGANPAVQFAQLDAVRERRLSQAFGALSKRQDVANDYDARVLAYQSAVKSKDAKVRKSAGGMVSGLKSTCAALVKADDDYTRALEAEAAVEQQAITLAQTLKAKDPSWADAEKASTTALADTQKQIDASKQLRAANEKACPKEKY